MSGCCSNSARSSGPSVSAVGRVKDWWERMPEWPLWMDGGDGLHARFDGKRTGHVYAGSLQLTAPEAWIDERSGSRLESRSVLS